MSGGRLAARYTLIHPLGSGGMGKVWLARDEMLDREVAVKELTLPEGLGEAERADAVTRAVREAQATAQLRHPGIVALHDVVVEYGRPWLIMELLRGRTLAEALRESGPMPPAQAARIGADVLEALTAAHSRGLQHRDVKPANVFLTGSGRVVLTDFGIARQEGAAPLTEAGLMIGSPGFIAPERLEGDHGGPASDLWSLGATVYAAVEGVTAYEGTPMDRLRATLTQAPRPPRLAGPLGQVVSAMMARDPGARPDPWTTINALRQVAAGQAPQFSVTQDLTAPGRARPPRRAGRAWWVVAAVVAVAVAVSAAVVILAGNGRSAPQAYTLPVDLCSLLTPEEAGALLGMAEPPAGQASNDEEEGPSCAWTRAGTGIALQAQKDSDTPDPWSMTAQSAHTLFANMERYWNDSDEVRWTWEEIGAKGPFTAKITPTRRLAGRGEEAFAFEMTGPGGRAHSSLVYYRIANLVVKVEYTTIGAGPTDERIRRSALTLAELTERALRAKA